MKNLVITKGQKVQTTDARDLKIGVVAFQWVDFKINYFGTVIETGHDTRIMKDGKQTVIGGCGFIPHGYELN